MELIRKSIAAIVLFAAFSIFSFVHAATVTTYYLYDSETGDVASFDSFNQLLYSSAAPGYTQRYDGINSGWDGITSDGTNWYLSDRETGDIAVFGSFNEMLSVSAHPGAPNRYTATVSYASITWDGIMQESGGFRLIDTVNGTGYISDVSSLYDVLHTNLTASTSNGYWDGISLGPDGYYVYDRETGDIGVFATLNEFRFANGCCAPYRYDGINTGWDGLTIVTTTVVDPPATVPVPAAVWLFGTGLLSLVGVARRKKAE